jgi:hypothetical protein
MGCPISPDKIAREWTPTPRAPADKVAIILLKPLPSVAPLKDGKKKKKKKKNNCKSVSHSK